ncbi:MAG: alpha-amylase family glycosyl hydrolase [Pseudomonadota bacterium]
MAILSACTTPAPRALDYTPEPYVQVEHPEWARDAVIYQINTRQFTDAGTFVAAEAELPRLAELGIDIVWLMPIHPIGEVNRKGSLGSPYAVKDYLAVNPEFGTLEDLKSFIDTAHNLDLHVILDWVANHTAWDNPLTLDHPEWYIREWNGDFRPTPWVDWADIIDLDYRQAGLREYMSNAMRYWVEEVGVDGFRADVAGYVPLDFWEDVRANLDQVKPIFMLAEYEQRDVHARAFNASYAWGWKNTMQAVARGDANASAFDGYYGDNEAVWPQDAYRMVYTSNHDQNAWDEAAPVLYGDAYENAIALSFVSEGIPLIYNGQEAFNTDRLEFFEDDPIRWRAHPIAGLFARLIALKTETTALHNGAAGARMVPVANTAPEQVLSFTRLDNQGGVFAVFNMSAEPAAASFTTGPYAGDYTDAYSGEAISIPEGGAMEIPAWSHRILVRDVD